MAEELAPWDDGENQTEPWMNSQQGEVPQQESDEIDFQENVQAKQEGGGIGETLTDTAMSLVRGFNPFVNTIGAAIMSAMDEGMSYDQAKEWYDKDTARREARSPVTSTIAGVGGAMLLPIPGTTSAKLGANAGKLARFLGMSKNVAKNGLVHGGFGAAYGAAEGNTTEERVQNALWGGAFGAGGGILAQPMVGAAEKLALRAIAKSEMAIEKMAAYIPGGAKKIGKFFLAEAIISPVGSLKGTLKRIQKVVPKVKTQYDNLLDMASEHGARLNMSELADEVSEKIIMPLASGDSRTERLLAKKILNEFPGWYETPVRTLKQANNARVAMDDVLSDVYLRLKEAKMMGGKGPLMDRKFAEVRSMFAGMLDDKIDEALEGVASTGGISKWRETKTTWQMLIEAEQAATQKLGKSPGIKGRDYLLMTAMPFGKYTSIYPAVSVLATTMYGRAAGVGARAFSGASKLAGKAGPLAVRTTSKSEMTVPGEGFSVDDVDDSDIGGEDTESAPWENYQE